MVPIRRLKRDKAFEKLMLEFTKFNFLLEELPEELPMNATNTEINHFNSLSDSYNSSLSDVVNYIASRYGEEDKNKVTDIIEELHNYYVEKHGIDKIMQMANQKPKTSGMKQQIPDFDILKHILNEESDKCVDCGTKRTRLSFENLPNEEKETFKDDIDDADYFVYCTKCKSYSVMFKTHFGGFGSDN